MCELKNAKGSDQPLIPDFVCKPLIRILLLLLLLAAVTFNQVQPLRINYLAS